MFKGAPVLCCWSFKNVLDMSKMKRWQTDSFQNPPKNLCPLSRVFVFVIVLSTLTSLKKSKVEGGEVRKQLRKVGKLSRR